MDLTTGIGVDAGEVLVITLANLEGTVLGVVGGIVGAPDTVVDVFAVATGVRASGVASLETEEVSTEETGRGVRDGGRGEQRGSDLLVPLNHLLVIILVVTAPSIRVDETAERVSSEIGTVGVHLASRVIGLEVHLRLVNKTNDLDVVGSLHELNALERAAGDKTGSVARFGTPCDGLVFGLTNSGGTLRRSPETEV